jgi:1-acyl-sn-glycerol-3-phosphate acyltransferase
LTDAGTEVPGAGAPRRGNVLSRALGRALLRCFGWRIEGAFPELPKCVTIGAPHTSNWDFFFGICTVFALGLRFDWIGKHTLFRPPFGGFMRLLGGTPLNRQESEGTVEQIAEIISSRESFILCLAPEGTRGRVRRWKTGFYHIALQAGVPIVPAYIDYRRRVVGFGPTFHPTGAAEREIEALRSYYRRHAARHPERA